MINGDDSYAKITLCQSKFTFKLTVPVGLLSKDTNCQNEECYCRFFPSPRTTAELR